MLRTGMCRFGFGNWIFLAAAVMFTYAQGGDDTVLRFTIEPFDAVVREGGSATLACAVSVRGARLSWRHARNGVPDRDHALAPTDQRRKQLSNGSLHIESVTEEMTGYYQCVASVAGVGTCVSRAASLKIAELPTLEPTPRTVLGVAGAPALLPCGLGARRVLGAGAPDRRVYAGARPPPSPPQPPLNVTWYKDGLPLQVGDARISLTPSGALELAPAVALDAATYRCRVALPHGVDYRESEPIELRVSSELGAAEYPPRFIVTPQPATVVEGDSVTFDCAAVGNPEPEITWLNNGQAIDLSDLDSRLYLVGAGSLRVQGARALDAGAYTCRAASALDAADAHTHLKVLTQPRVTIPGPGVKAAGLRSTVTLRCEARGRPAPRVTWLKDGDALTPNHHDIAIVDGYSLRISGVLGVDAGVFQCYAASAAGAAQHAVRLRVLPAGAANATDKTKPKIPKKYSKKFFQSLKTDIQTDTQANRPSNHQILTSLVSDHDSYEDTNFLGETSSAYVDHDQLLTDGDQTFSNGDQTFSNGDQPSEGDQTFPSEDSFSDDYTEYDDEDLLHAAKGPNLDALSPGGGLGAPRGLRAVIVKNRFVTLSWEAGDGGNVSGYAVLYRVAGSERERVLTGAAARHEVNVAALEPNTTYSFTVAGYSDTHISPHSEAIEVTTPAEEFTVGPPTDLEVEAVGPHSVRVKWTPPVPPPGAPRGTEKMQYRVEYTEVESNRVQYAWVEGAPSTTLAGLRAGATYTVRAAAAGGAWGPPATVRTASDVPAAPPANITAVATGPHSILVRWEAPAHSTHRGTLTGYKLRYRLAPAAGGPAGGPKRRADSLTTPADSRRAEISGLSRGTEYQVRICAINAVGAGPFSEWLPAATSSERAQPALPAPPARLTTRAGRDWISVWWSGGEGGEAEGAPPGGYQLGWGRGVPDEQTKDLPAQLRSHVIRNLQPDSEYVISLRASNALGAGPPVYATVRTAGGPGGEEEAEDPDEEEGEEDEEEEAPPLIPPLGLKAIMLSGTTAVLYWTDPTLPKGQLSTDGRRYLVRWAGAGGGGGGGGGGAGAGGVRARSLNVTDLNCMIDDLRPFTNYEFSVKLIKGGRESAWSMIVSNTTLEAPPGSPPRELRPAPIPGGVELTWAPPAKPNGIITGYVVMYAVAEGAEGAYSWRTLRTAAPQRTALLTELRPRTRYTLAVQAANSAGLGPPSPPLLYTTPQELESPAGAGGAGGGFGGATWGWLWASAGGALAVLALAAALALKLCCRSARAPDTSTYQKAAAAPGVKPPDLWIHHDQMELKQMDKGLRSSNISSGSVEGALVSSTLTLAQYEPASRGLQGGMGGLQGGLGGLQGAPRPASLDRRQYVPAYVASEPRWSGSCSDSDAAPARDCARCRYQPMGGAGCASTCDRRHRDQGTPIGMTNMGNMPLGMGGMGPLAGGMMGGGGVCLSPQSSLASLQPPLPQHPPPAPCGSGTCPLGAACGAAGGPGLGVPPPAGPLTPLPPCGSDVYATAAAARERGHYVAYEPLGTYTHRDSLSSEGGLPPTVGAGGSSAGGSLPRGRAAPLHSFTLPPDSGSNRSTPSHGRGSVRDTSPYKKSASSSPAHAHAHAHLPSHRHHLGSVGPHSAAELEPLTPSRSTERLQREMQNLEGLMKDLSAITQQQFHC